MKHFARMALLLFTAMVVLAGCGVTNTTSFTSRSRYIEGGRIKEQPKAAEIDVDFSQRVTAQSGWQASIQECGTHRGGTQGDYGIWNRPCRGTCLEVYHLTHVLPRRRGAVVHMLQG